MKNRVLIIDDNEQSRKVARFALQSCSEGIDEVADGDAALGVLLNERPDLLILDWKMPHLSGPAMITIVDDIMSQIENINDGNMLRSRRFDVIVYSSLKIEELMLPKAKHFRFVCYISKEWTVDYQIKKFKSITKRLQEPNYE